MLDANNNRNPMEGGGRADIDPAFTRQVISRVRARVFLQDMMVLIFEGFSVISLGLLRLFSDNPETKPTKKESRDDILE